MREPETMSTFANEKLVPLTVTSENIGKLFKALKEANSQPFVNQIVSRHEWWKLVTLDPTLRGYSLYGGIPCFKDEGMEEGIARICMSDGTYEDVKISSTPHPA